jgi:predicted DCC family thiol-disulfide oxidoreductase YuxK
MATVVFYDGLCGLCDRLVRFLVSHDVRRRLRFAMLQGELARRALVPRGYDPDDLDTLYVLAGADTADARVLARSRAVLHAVRELGGAWSVLASVARVVPRVVADGFYDVVAKNRYRIFGRFETCPLPSRELRERFASQVRD